MTAAFDDASEFFDEDFSPASKKATYEGTQYSCIKYKQKNSVSTLDAGEASESTFQLMFKASDFTSPPLPRKTIIYGGITYRILEVNPDSSEQTYILTLGKNYG